MEIVGICDDFVPKYQECMRYKELSEHSSVLCVPRIFPVKCLTSGMFIQRELMLMCDMFALQMLCMCRVYHVKRMDRIYSSLPPISCYTHSNCERERRKRAKENASAMFTERENLLIVLHRFIYAD